MTKLRKYLTQREPLSIKSWQDWLFVILTFLLTTLLTYLLALLLAATDTTNGIL